MRPFEHQSLARRVVFGAGTRRQVPAEVDHLGRRRAMVLTGGSSTGAGREVAERLGPALAGVLDEVRQHVPRELADRATATVQQAGADVLVSVGGGSATGLAKAVAVALGLPIVAVPTTYAGSEMTPVWAVTDERKHTARDPGALPAVVVYDPELTVGLPAAVSAASGMNAIAQAVAAMVHEPHDPVAAGQGAEAVRTLLAALPVVVRSPSDLDARGDALYGTFLAGMALAATGGSPHHRLVHAISGGRGLVHADVHAVLLPQTTAVLLERDPTAAARAATATGTSDLAGALHELAVRTGAPTTLREAGITDEAVAEAVGILGDDGAWDPDTVRALFSRVPEGDPPIAVSNGSGRMQR